MKMSKIVNVPYKHTTDHSNMEVIFTQRRRCQIPSEEFISYATQ
jgi:hypothetical protein